MSNSDSGLKVTTPLADVEGSQELKPCPFCGASNNQGHQSLMTIDGEIYCGGCGARGGTVDGTLRTAADRWNTRSDASGYVRGLEAAVDAIEADDVMYWPMADNLRALISQHQEGTK